MLRNYLKIALRNLRKQVGYTAINVIGLSFGVACCLLIVMLLHHEWTFDAFHEHADRIHRVVIQETRPDGSIGYRQLIQPSVGPAADSAYAGIERMTRVIAGDLHVHKGDQTFAEHVYMADSAFFDMFSFPLLAGSPRTALRDMQGMVISEKLATKYFNAGSGDYDRVIGEHLAIKQGAETFDFTVSGVMESIPDASSFQFDVLISFDNFFLEENGRIYLGGNDWGGKNTLFVMLGRDQEAKAMEAALAPFTKVELAGRIDGRRGAGYIAEDDDAFKLILQPLRQMHLDPVVGTAYAENAHNPTYSYVLGGIGLLVLLIACINFVTLSIGRSMTRAREVGMRKVLGAHRSQLMKQFWGEALLLTLAAVAIAVLLVQLALPEFNVLTGKDLSFSDTGGLSILLTLGGLMALVGIAAGIYPAAVLSAFRPAAVLKGEFRMGRSRFTRGLIVAQYCISIGLIFATIVMYRQLDFMLNKDLGFEDDQVLVLHTPGLNTRQERLALQAVRSGTASDPNVTHVLKTGYAFTHSHDGYSWTNADGETVQAHMLGVDYDFLDVLDMELVAGRDFARDFPSDSTRSVLVNEAFVREYDIDEPVGHVLAGFGGFFGEYDPTIIGVVKDFNFRSLHEEVEAAVLNMHPDYYHGMSHMLVKLRPHDLAGTIGMLETIWTQTFPEKPFHYSFLDDDIAAQYHNERRWSRMLSYSSLLAILIACMGLFGLATLSVSGRRKEIGIRKVLGASIPSIAGLVSREFALLVGIATVVSWPIAFFGMREWLAGFAYRTDVAWWIFIAAGGLALFIAMATVSYQAVRAAATDPVKSLRNE